MPFIDNKYFFVCHTKEEDGYISLLTNKFSYKILKNNRDKIDWNLFSLNTNIFKIIRTIKYYKLFDSLLHLNI